MGTSASLRHFRMSARKVRLVADLIRGMQYDQAVATLAHMNKKAAPVLLKLLKSAAANTEETTELAPDELFVSKVHVDGGRMLKRIRPCPMGRAARIRKRLSHITVELGERP